MKRILSLTTMLLFTIASFAYDAKINGIYYDLYAGVATVTYYSFDSSENATAYSGNVIIPESVIYKGSIYDVKNIRDYSFRGCYGITSVTIPHSITSIGYHVFEECSSLTRITIPSSVTLIDQCAFGANVYSVVVESGNTIYDSRNNCNAIIETSSNMLISGCKNTIIPNSVKSIYDEAFVGCSGLISVSIPYGVTVIGRSAFGGCTSLASIIIPNSVNSIGYAAFSGCTSLTSVRIPGSVKNIGNSAFNGCSELNDVYNESMIPQGIWEETFTSYSTATLHVPVGTKELYQADYRWMLFSKIVDDITIVYIDGICYEISGDEATVVQGNEPYSDNVVIPNTVVYDNKTYDVTKIDDGAFKDSPNLVSVTIPESVTVIGEDAFSNCPNLVTIYNEAINPQVLTGDPGFDESTTVHVPEGSKDSYKNADYWKDFSNIVDDIPTAINNVSGNVYLKVKSNFSIDGKSISRPQKGMNIQKMSDGTTIKVLKD
ncbi:MAG: leucine-rich repeat domain-containing protein [Prevotella sp.]|nr:leucine-rich repeat domain-containing protein [Prevotella sp.]